MEKAHPPSRENMHSEVNKPGTSPGIPGTSPGKTRTNLSKPQTTFKLSQGRLSFLQRHTDHIIAVALGLLVFTWLMSSLDRVGIGRDEGIYMNAAETYWNWAEGADFQWRQMRKQKWLDEHYEYNWEHPPLVKHLAGWSWRTFHRCNCPEQHGLHKIRHRNHRYKENHKTLGLLSEIEAFRLPTVILSSVLVALIYLFGAAAFGRLAGLTAALMYFTMPRVFFHSHLAALDAPVTATMFIAVFAYWKALHKARWAIPAGLLFGLALSTKLNAFFLPLLFAVHYAYASRDRFRSQFWSAIALMIGLPAMLFAAYIGATNGNYWAMGIAAILLAGLYLLRKDSLGRPLHSAGLTVPAVFWLQASLGLGFLFLTWPRLWTSPVQRFGAYLNYHLHHVFYNTEYFGQNFNLPPFPVLFPFIMTLITIPAVVCLLSILGLAFQTASPVKETLKKAGNIYKKLRAQNPVPESALTEEEIANNKEENSKNKNAVLKHKEDIQENIIPPAQASQTRENNPRGFLRPMWGFSRSESFLVSIFAVFPLALISAPSTPIFGGTRTWMPAMPFIALLAGVGLQTICCRIIDIFSSTKKTRLAALIAGGACLLAVAPGFFQTLHAGETAPSYYTPIIGGTRGGATLGMKRQYWGYTTRQVLDWMNRELPQSTRVYPHDTIGFALNLYKRDGLLKPGVHSSGGEYWGVARSRYAIFHHEKHQVMWEFLIWQEYGTFKPVKVMTLDGVPLLYIYGPKKNRMGPPYFMDPPHLKKLPRKIRR